VRCRGPLPVGGRSAARERGAKAGGEGSEGRSSGGVRVIAGVGDPRGMPSQVENGE